MDLVLNYFFFLNKFGRKIFLIFVLKLQDSLRELENLNAISGNFNVPCLFLQTSSAAISMTIT